MKNIIYCIIALLLFGCQDKEIQLPEAVFDSQTTLKNVSLASIYFNEKTGVADFDDDKLSNKTDWVMNGDKRLNLGQILPYMTSLFNRKDNMSIDSKENIQIYLSGYDPDKGELVYLNITKNRFTEGSALSYFTNSGRDLDFSNKVFVSIQNDHKVTIIDEEDQIITDYRDFHKMIFKVLQKSRIPKTVFMSYDAKLSYQDFFTLKSTVDHVTFINGQLAQNEFIYK